VGEGAKPPHRIGKVKRRGSRVDLKNVAGGDRWLQFALNGKVDKVGRCAGNVTGCAKTRRPAVWGGRGKGWGRGGVSEG